MPSSGRRHFLDGGFALSVFGLAVLIGFLVLAPHRFHAAPAAALLAAREPQVAPAVTMPTAAMAPIDEAMRVPEPGPGPGTANSPEPAAAPKVQAAQPESPGTERPAVRAPEVKAPKVEAPGVEAPKVEAARAPDTRPWPSPVRGRVLDERREPLAGASVVADGVEVRTEADGEFTFERLSPGSRLLVKMPGYAKATVEPTMDPVEAVLKPQMVKAAYLTYFGVNDRGIRGRVLDLISRTELNAVVIDVKGDRGWILYPTEVPLAREARAQGPSTMREFSSLMAELKARGIYTIARIVAFKDNVLANHRADLAIIDTRTGKPWIDNERLAWVDPFREEVWAYNIAIAREAVARGFDEIQFDYVRFPTDGRLSTTRYSKPNNRDTRLPAIAAFLDRARRGIGPAGAFLAADIFGYTAFNENDTDIGQRIEELAPHLDFICPMVYPSGYHRGIPGYRNPVEHPYQVVHESVRLIRKRSAHAVVRVRPWLQDFRDYAFDRRIFGVGQVRAQVRGADEAGAVGWMLWNPRNDYTGAALRPKGTLAATGDAGRPVPD